MRYTISCWPLSIGPSAKFCVGKGELFCNVCLERRCNKGCQGQHLQTEFLVEKSFWNRSCWKKFTQSLIGSAAHPQRGHRRLSKGTRNMLRECRNWMKAAPDVGRQSCTRASSTTFKAHQWKYRQPRWCWGQGISSSGHSAYKHYPPSLLSYQLYYLLNRFYFLFCSFYL